MTAPPTTLGTDQGSLEVPEEGWRPRRRRRRVIVLVIVIVVIAAGAWVAIANPFASKPSSSGNGGAVDNAYPTSLQAVGRQDLSSQTEVSGTLTYAGATKDK